MSRSGVAEPAEAADIRRDPVLTGEIDGVPDELAAIYRECAEALQTAADPEHAEQLTEILLSVEAAARRRKLPFDRHELRPMTEDKITKILELYDKTVLELYRGLKYRV